LTAEGNLIHDRAHDESLREKRVNVIVVRGLAVRSATLGLAGKCDVVEFHRDDSGHPLRGEEGLWREFPVEYKHGISKASDEDRLQLCAQAMCLEEMLGSDIAVAYLYYARTRSRECVEITRSLRVAVGTMAREMHELYARRHVPCVRMSKRCKACSLRNVCVPEVASRKASTYINAMLGE
jgi:CRISPR-associated exonuclease Cas4